MKTIKYLTLSLSFYYIQLSAQQITFGPDGMPSGESVFPVSEHLPQNQIPGIHAAGIFFNDSFEDKTYNQWTDQGGGYLISVDSLNSPDGIFHLKITGGNHLHQNGLAHIFSPKLLDYVGFYVRYLGGPGDIGGYFVIVPSGGFVIPSLFFFIFWNDGTMRIYEPGSNYIPLPYTSGQWYHIEFKNINWITQTLDWYVDNTLIASDFPFRASGDLTSVSEAHIYNWDSSEAEYDQVILSGYPVGISGRQASMRIDVFPNPVRDDLYIIASGMKKARLELSNIAGKRVFQMDVTDKKCRIDAGSMQSGIYLLMLKDEDSGYLYTKRIVIAH